MSAVPPPDPAPGQHGEQPPLPDGARDEAAPACVPPDDPAQDGTAPGAAAPKDMAGSPVPSGGADDAEQDAAADLARMLDDIEAGLIEIPPEDEPAPAVTFALGEAADVDQVELAAMVGPDGLGGQSFSQHRAADAMRPGPLLSVLAEQAAGQLDSLSADELLGVISATRRLANRAEYLELSAVAEFTRRARVAYAASVAARVRPGRRDGEFAAAELAMELVTSENSACDRMELALALATRLPATFAGLSAGTIDGGKAQAIWFYTRFLSDADAAEADAILAPAAPGLRYDQLARRAAKLEDKLDPQGAKRRKEHASASGRRVETRRELSGNMSFGGRELGVAEALAAKAFNDADAAALRRAGVTGSLRELRVIAMLDRMTGRDPLDRLTSPAPAPDSAPDAAPAPAPDSAPDAAPAPAPDPAPDPEPAQDPAPAPGPAATPAAGCLAPASPGVPDGRDCRPGRDDPAEEDGDGTGEEIIWCPAVDDDIDDDDWQPCDDPAGPGPGGPGPGGPGGGPRGPGSPAGGQAPVPAVINLVIPAGTLLGWSTAPGDAGTWGILDCDDSRSMVQTASQHPATRWCVTVTGPDGTAIAHGCARGRHRWAPAPCEHSPPAPRAGPDAHQRAQLAALLRALNVTLSPIASGTCDHRHREDRYTPSRALGHLVRARTATCPAPGCNAQAIHNDLDHTISWPAGPTDECNISPPCRRHHRVKQAPGWRLEQPQSGLMRWTAPSGRVYTTTPTVYDV